MQRIVALVASLVLIVSADAYAQPDPAADSLYDQAVSLYRDGQFLKAAKAFQEAYVLAGADVLLLNAARSWEKGGDRAAATKLYSAVIARKGLSADIKSKAQEGLARLTARPVEPLPSAAGTWVGTASVGGVTSTISVTLAPTSDGVAAGALYAPGFRCGASLIYVPSRKETWRFETARPVGEPWCKGLRTLELRRTGPETAKLTWKHKRAGRFVVLAVGEAPPAQATVAAARAPASRRKSSGSNKRTRRIVIAGDIAAADDAMQAAVGWVGGRIQIAPVRGTAGFGKLIGVRGTVLIVGMDDGSTWTGDIMDLSAIAHYPIKKK